MPDFEKGQSSDFQLNRPTIITLLYFASFVTGITSIIGVVLAYIWNGEPHDGWEDSYYRYLIRTFWIGVLYSVIATVLAVLLIGFLLFIVIAVWFIVRSVRSLLAAQKRQPVANVDSWLF